MPKLRTLTTKEEESYTFKYINHITIESKGFQWYSRVDLPRLKKVYLPNAFENKNDVTINGSAAFISLIKHRHWCNGATIWI